MAEYGGAAARWRREGQAAARWLHGGGTAAGSVSSLGCLAVCAERIVAMVGGTIENGEQPRKKIRKDKLGWALGPRCLPHFLDTWRRTDPGDQKLDPPGDQKRFPYRKGNIIR